MTRFQVFDTYKWRFNLIGEYNEHPTIQRWHAPCGIIWVCLVTGVNQSKWFNLSDLRECPLVGCEPPPPMHIYPMPDQFPREVFLGLVNYALELKRRAIELQGAVSEAVADGQLPRAA